MDMASREFFYPSHCRIRDRQDAWILHLQLTLEKLTVMHAAFKHLNDQSEKSNWLYLENVLDLVTRHIHSACVWLTATLQATVLSCHVCNHLQTALSLTASMTKPGSLLRVTRHTRGLHLPLWPPI